MDQTPLFQVMFAWQNNEEGEIQLPGMTLKPVEMNYDIVKFDLDLALTESNGEIVGGLSYSTALFDHSTIERHVGYLQTMLQAMANDAIQSIDAVDILSSSERELLLQTWNTIDLPSPDYPCIHQYFESQVTQSPDAIALVHEDQSMTYSELNARTNVLAHHLISLGVGPETLVAICVERSLALVVGILAILKSGGAYVPLDPVYASGRLCDIISDASPSILLADKLGCDAIGESIVSSLTVIDPNVRMEGSIENPEVASLASHNLAHVIYTSGSTGKPKGVMVEHAQVTRLFDATVDWYHFSKNDTWMMSHSCGFDVSVWELWGALRYGGKLVIPSHSVIQSPEDLYRLICKEGVTILDNTPSAFKPLVRHLAEVEHRDQLRYIVMVGEALEPVNLKPWYAMRPENSPQIVNKYGPTETTVYSMYRAIKEQDCNQFVSPIGVRLPDLTAYVLDTQGRPAPLGVAGELFIGGAGVTRGYLNRPELTSERFLPDPFSKTEGARMYKTGDLVRYLPDGNFIYLGRNDFQVKIRGFRIELGEIEARLMDHPLVHEAVVVVVGTDSDKRLVAYVVSDAVDHLAQLLRDHLAAVLPEYMIPAAFVQLDALPLTTNGKLNRQALPEPEGDAFASQDYEAPFGETETALAAIWADVLKIERVGRNDSFFMLGGHSLLAVKMIGLVRLNLGFEMKLRTLFEAPTIAQLSVKLLEVDDTQEDLLDILMPLRTQGNRRPLFCVHALLGLAWSYTGLLSHLPKDQPVYGLQARGFNGKGKLPESIEDMAKDYIDQIRRVQPHGPYQLLGWSFGGSVAYSMAVQLEKLGEKVDLLALMDTPTEYSRLEEEDELSATEALYRQPSDQSGGEESSKDGMTLLKKAQHVIRDHMDLANESSSSAHADARNFTQDELRALMNQGQHTRMNNMRLAEKYSPAVFTGDMLFFNATVRALEHVDTVNPQRWEQFVLGNIEVHKVKCQHIEMDMPEPIAEVGRVLNLKLKELHQN
ncbi:hypothetical protein BGZ79_001642 [Entomortierella chlamydospora]|nr:hypothetical protein BGZ79_001642 [Entomortierella chlamydospora]